MHSTAPARRLATRLQMRPCRNQDTADDDREHEPEKATDEQPGDQYRRDTKRHRPEQTHPVTPGVKQPSKRSDKQSNENQPNDV